MAQLAGQLPSYDDPAVTALVEVWAELLLESINPSSATSEQWLLAGGIPIAYPVFVAEHEQQIEQLRRIGSKVETR